MNVSESAPQPREFTQDELAALMQNGFALSSRDPKTESDVINGESWEFRDPPDRKLFVSRAITYLERGGELTERQKQSLYDGVKRMRIVSSKLAQRYRWDMEESIQELGGMQDSLADLIHPEKPEVSVRPIEMTNLLQFPRQETTRKRTVPAILKKFIGGTIHHMGESGPYNHSHWS